MDHEPHKFAVTVQSDSERRKFAIMILQGLLSDNSRADHDLEMPRRAIVLADILADELNAPQDSKRDWISITRERFVQVFYEIYVQQQFKGEPDVLCQTFVKLLGF